MVTVWSRMPGRYSIVPPKPDTSTFSFSSAISTEKAWSLRLTELTTTFQYLAICLAMPSPLPGCGF